MSHLKYRGAKKRIRFRAGGKLLFARDNVALKVNRLLQPKNSYCLRLILPGWNIALTGNWHLKADSHSVEFSDGTANLLCTCESVALNLRLRSHDAGTF